MRVRPTLDNGGFSDEQWGQNGAQILTFDSVPAGVYTVQVSGVGSTGEAEWARKVINVGSVGSVQGTEWKVVTGKATIAAASIDLPNGGETRVMSTRPKANSLYASIDNVTSFDVPSLSAAIAAAPCRWPAPTGTQIGFRTWGSPGSALFQNTTLNRPSGPWPGSALRIAGPDLGTGEAACLGGLKAGQRRADV